MCKLLITLVLATTVLLSGCDDPDITAKNKTIDGITYSTWGLANEADERNPNILYEVSGWSIFWSIIFSETIIVPIYFFGWDLYQPVSKKPSDHVKGQVLDSL